MMIGKKLNISVVFVLSALLFVACEEVLPEGEQNNEAELSGEIEVFDDQDFVFEETEFDFGILKQSGGIISHNFEFEYLGDEPIEVMGVPASCACTVAEISEKIFQKGDKGVLIVEFDPNLHEEPEGKFFKTVSILTEPELEKQPEIKIWAEIDLDLGPEAYKLKEVHID